MVTLTGKLRTPRSSRYRVADNVNLPLRIIPAVQEEGRSRVTINLKVSADFSYKLFGSNIVVKVGGCGATTAGELLNSNTAVLAFLLFVFCSYLFR